ncbi:MAG: HAMP domain-containing histidine kinase [Variovorax sp.]|nr:MAG: HAMP domain-containing histidine kinase [Variovorax sp.]
MRSGGRAARTSMPESPAVVEPAPPIPVAPPVLPASDARARSIQTDLLTIFLRGSRFRQNVGGALMTIFVICCWGHAAGPALLLWLIAGLSIIAVRQRTEVRYLRGGVFDDEGAQAAFVRTMRPIYGVHGALWGFSLVFSFDRIPVYNQLGCWLVLACAASAPLTSVALVPRLQRVYTNTLFSLVIGVILVMTATRESSTEVPHYLLLGISVFYWWLLGHYGLGIHQNQTEQSGLQYDVQEKAREARAAVETKDRFLAAAAHDMRQPVMALSLYAEHLVSYPEMQAELAPKIAAASQAVKHMFESLFDLANLDSGQVILQVEKVRTAEMLVSLGVQFGPLAAAKGIELRLRGAPRVIRSDSVRLQRMIGNVVGNAIKYSPPGGRILLAVRSHADGVRVQVWDQGLGIPAQDIDRIFQEFYRVDRADAPVVDGMGLGLSIVARLSKVLNARIHVRSVVGRGTCFTIDLSDVDDGDAAKHTTSLDVG